MRILSSLPKSYNPLVTAWNLLPKDQQSLETLKLKLLEEEECLKDQHKIDKDTKAFATWSVNKPRQSQRNQWETSGPSESGGRNSLGNFANPGRNNYTPGTGGRPATLSTLPSVTPTSGRYVPSSHLTGRGGSPYANSQHNNNNPDSQTPLTYEQRRE